MSPDQKFDCFNNPDMKKIVARANEVLIRAVALAKEKVMQHVEAGELLKVDENKLDAIISFVDDKPLMSNLKKGVFIR